jgi:hypothetical protein
LLGLKSTGGNILQMEENSFRFKTSYCEEEPEEITVAKITVTFGFGMYRKAITVKRDNSPYLK